MFPDYGKGVIRNVTFETLRTQIQLILSRIYSLFQHKIYTKNDTWSGKSADTAKSIPNAEKNAEC